MNTSTQSQATEYTDVNSRPGSRPDRFQELKIGLKRSSAGSFGFAITGGAEESSAIRVEHIESGGSADVDGRLKVNDLILRVNDVAFVEIGHDEARAIFQHAGRGIEMHLLRPVPAVTDESPRNRLELFSEGCIANKEKAVSNFDLRNSRNTETTKEYDVGTYGDLQRRSERGGDLKIYHLILKEVAPLLIPGYSEEEAIGIVLRKSKRTPASAEIRAQGKLSLFRHDTKEALAHAIGCNTKLRSIPGPVLLEAIRQHCQRFPYAYARSSSGTSIEKAELVNCDGNEIATKIPFLNLNETGQLEEVLEYGNCVKDLPLPIYYLFVERKITRPTRYKDYDDLSEKYVMHRDIDPVTNRPRCLMASIEFDKSETKEEKSDKRITIIKTNLYNIVLKYE